MPKSHDPQFCPQRARSFCAATGTTSVRYPTSGKVGFESHPQGSFLSCANRGIGPPLAGSGMDTRLKLEHIEFRVRREMK